VGIVAGWLHVGRDALESVLGQQDWTAAKLQKALADKGMESGDVDDLVYGGHDVPDPRWNAALARLAEVKRFDLDKAFTGSGPNLTEVVACIPGAQMLLAWTRMKPALTVMRPWRRDDIDGFEVVATADQVRSLLPSVQPFRDRAHCDAFAIANAGLLPAFVSSRKRALRAWTQDGYYWDAWLRTLEAMESVASSRADYLGFETG
jgi:hypothetical protein